MQRWGESRRDPAYKPGITGPDYWVRRAAGLLAKEADKERHEYEQMDKFDFSGEFKEHVIIFDDMRYPNEVELIVNLGGTTVFIDGMARLPDIDAEWRRHESEQLAMLYSFGHLPDLFDFYVNNNYGEDALKKLVDHLAPAWLDMEIMT